MDERTYRRTQRQLGEAQVALRLLGDLLKARPDLAGIQEAVNGTMKAKADLFRQVVAMEQAMDAERIGRG